MPAAAAKLRDPGREGTAQHVSLHTKRPLPLRLDVLPFAAAYLVLVYLYLTGFPEGGTRYIPTVYTETPSNGTSPAVSLNGTEASSNGTSSAAGSNGGTEGENVADDGQVDTGLTTSFWAFCALPLLAACHVLLLFASYWSIRLRCLLQYNLLEKFEDSSEMYACAVPYPHCGAPKMCRVLRGDREWYFIFQENKYLWKRDAFEPLSFPTSKPISDYISHKGLTGGRLSEARSLYPMNEFNIPLPAFQELFKEHALAPFFVFQVFCVGLWCLDEYWYYSVITLIMLFIFEKQVVNRRIDNLQKLRDMRMPPYYIHVYRKAEWKLISTSDLLPGDLVELRASEGEGTPCPCDCLLLSGSCVVNEAMLTGESVPQVKEPLTFSAEDEKLSIEKKHKQHIVFGGTNIILTDDHDRQSNGKNPNANAVQFKVKPRSARDKHCIAYVLRTGFGTSQGTLVRTILFSTERVSVNNTESLLFILFLVVFAVIASAYVLMKGLEDSTRSRYKLILNCIMIVTSVVPPELPMELSLAVNTSLLELFKQDIFCTEPFRIPMAGAVDVCCFDKTGTLTSDHFNVLGASDFEGKHSEILDPSELRPEQLLVLAGCHSLVNVPGKGLIGDPMEIAAFNAIGWSLNKKQVAVSKRRDESVRVHVKFPFSSELQRMSTVIEAERRGEFWITAKGSPEKMAERFSTLPEDYKQVHHLFSSQGCRVLALGFRRVGPVSEHRREVRFLTRSEAERGLHFAGFLVLHCPLKKHSLDTVSQLTRSTHRVVMITGDHTLTACHVSSQLGISKQEYPGKSLILKLKNSNDDSKNSPPGMSSNSKSSELSLEWESVDLKGKKIFSLSSTRRLSETFDLCVSGSVLERIQKMHGMDGVQALVPYVTVFARFSPAQKELVLITLKKLGLTTLMCGDGTNDVGALKQAHVGVALIKRENLTINTKPRLLAKSTEVKPDSGIRSHGRTSLPRSRMRRSGVTKLPPKRVQKQNAANSTESDKPEAKGNPRTAPKTVMGIDLEEEELGVVRLGDASIASPFTSKRPYVIAVVQIIRQGRCALVTTYQMFRILALNCLVSAYSMSVLYLDGVKYGDTQMTIASLAITFFFFFISRSTPLKELSVERPPPSLFNFVFFAEILGQFAMHLFSLMTAVTWALPHTPRDKETMDPDGEFKPNILNSVVFLISTSMTVATFLANYRGHPFMISLVENKLLLYSLLVTEFLLLICAMDVVPFVNRFMELAEMPNWEFRLALTSLMIADLVFTVLYAWTIRSMFKNVPTLPNVSKKDKNV